MTALLEQTAIQPAYMSVPPTRVASLVDVVCGYADLAGRQLDPEQRLSVDVLTSVDEFGNWAAPVGATIKSRQNGKTTGELEPIVLTELFDDEYPDRIVWTSHRFKTSREAFLDLRGMIESSEELSSRVARYSDARGEEGIYLDNDACVEFLARSRLQGRGLGGKLVVFDEAFALSQGILGALLPTLSARRNPLVLLGSSACMEDSLELWDVVQAGRSGADPGLAYVEYCAPGSFKQPGCETKGCMHTRGTPGCVMDRLDYREVANPGIARGRITHKFIEQVERSRLSPVEFGRERYGWHEEPIQPNLPPITLEMWQAKKDAESVIPAGAPVVFAAEIALDRRSASIGVAGWRADGSMHVGLIEHDYGTAWLLPRLLELKESHKLYTVVRGDRKNSKKCQGIILDPSSPAVDLVDSLRDAKIEPVLMTSREVGTACSGLQRALLDAGEVPVWHRGQPAVDTALDGAVKRDLGDGGWAFGRKKSAVESVDITPVAAVTNARWALTVAEKHYNVLDSVL
jgi:hypothetical protein